MIRRASDGLRARVVGPWTQDKLTYVEHYAKAFMTAMAPKRQQGRWKSLVYIDLLAGPGRCIDRSTKVEFDGSPLRALRVKPAFDHLYFTDLVPENIAALRKRIPSEDYDRVDCLHGNCNELIRDILKKFSGKTLGLAFLDPEGFEVRFETLRLLATRPIDILYLFPSGIGIARNLRTFARSTHSQMDDLWGGADWRELPSARFAAGQRLTQEEKLSYERPWVWSFRSKVAKLGFLYQDEGDPVLFNKRRVPMYHLLFFSKNPVGLTIWRGIKRIEPSGQRKLSI
jgi:three-Cys-motif partner protein